MTEETWLTKHPYLYGMANLQVLVDSAVAGAVIPTASTPVWDDYLDDFCAGVPLLRSSRIKVDLLPPGRALLSVARALASESLPVELASKVENLVCNLEGDDNLSHRAVEWLLARDTFLPSEPGLLRYLGWMVMARYLARVIAVFSLWRGEDRWMRNYCPTCGAFAGMAQLAGCDPARHRLLSCACCSTRWRYRRTGCPFCDTKDDRRLAILTVEGEAALRIEYCKECGGYLKTYSGEGNERLLLADWTSIHLDVIAHDHGLQRYAGSLFHL